MTEASLLANATRVLYLGMWTDVLTPLVVCPNLRLLVSLELEEQFASFRSLDGKMVRTCRDECLLMLQEGSDRNSLITLEPTYNITGEFRLPHGPCTDIRTEQLDNCFVFHFVYNGVPREYRVYNKNYCRGDWPECANEIQCVMSMGARIERAVKQLNKHVLAPFVHVSNLSAHNRASAFLPLQRSDGSDPQCLSVTMVTKPTRNWYKKILTKGDW